MKASTRSAALAALALAALAPFAGAQNYPTRPVRVIVTFPAGSATDILGRILANKLTEIWGQQVVVDNRGGAGGSIGSAIGARATPDGYTLIINSSAHTVNPALYAKLPYDTQKDFVDIAPLTGTPNVLVNNVNAKVRSLKDFIADAKARPGQINFASAGVGSSTHLNLEKFKLATTVDVTHIAFKGTPETVTNVMGARVDYYFCPLSACLPFVQEGKPADFSAYVRQEIADNARIVQAAGIKPM